MAEATTSLRLIADILWLIAGLRPSNVPAPV
jgi:hypothetical protein